MTRRSIMMTKKTLGVASLATLGLIVSCGTSVPSVSSSLPEETTLLASDVKDKVGLKTVTGLSILSSTPLVSTASAMMDQPFFVEGETDPVTEEVAVQDFTQYITLMDMLLSEEGAPFTVVERVSDRPEYAYLLDITTRDLAGIQLSYTLYFNYLGEPVDPDTSSETPSSETEVTSEDVSSEEASSATEVSSEESSLPPESSNEPSSEEVTSSTEVSSETNVSSEEIPSSTPESSTEPTSEPDQPSARMGDRDDDHDDDEEDEDDMDDDEDRDDHDRYDDSELRDESDRDDHDRYKDRELGDREDNEEVFIEGIAIFDGLEYELIGVQEVDIEEDETETSTKFFITLDDQNWIRIKSEVEVDLEDNETEEKYSVSMKKDDQFSKMSFKIETDNDGELKVNLKTLIQGELVSYTFRRKINEETGETYLLIRVIENGQVLHILAVPSLDETTGDIVYTFTVRETGQGYEGRPGHGDRGRDHDRR